MARLALAAVLCGLLCAGQGCSSPAERELVVATRLIPGWVAERRPHRPRACAAGDEIRPALGCTPRISLEPLGHGDSGNLLQRQRRYAVPKRARGRDWVVERLCRQRAPSGKPRLKFARPLLVRRLGAELALPPLERNEEDLCSANVRVWLRPIPAPRLETETRPVAVPDGAVLNGGIGVDPVAALAGASPVEFQLKVRTGPHERVLLQRVVRPAVKRWLDYRLDLGAFSGKKVRFVFSTRVLPERNQDPRQAFAFPLWGVADILEPRPRSARARNVILVSFDTLRADYVGVYGSELPTTPVLDSIAHEGAIFEQAITPYPSTTAAHMSMLTGVYPSVHQVFGPVRRLPTEIPTLAEILARRGYRTAAVTEDGMLAATSGFPRGFSYYREFKEINPARTVGHVREVVGAALRWLAEHNNERFFLFLHTYQVHGPYTPPPEFNIFTTYRKNGHAEPITADTPKAIRQRHAYAGEVRYADSELGKLFEGLASLGQKDRTILVVTGDHGQALGEHGIYGHGLTLIDEVLHVPLIVRAPGLVPAGVRVPALVSLVDIAPTLLDMVGIRPLDTMQGKSLVPLLGKPDAPEFSARAVFAERPWGGGARTVVVRKGRFKWVIDKRPQGSLVKLREHAYEFRGPSGQPKEITGEKLLAKGVRLADQYERQNRALRTRLGHPKPAFATPDERTVEKLRALGYVK